MDMILYEISKVVDNEKSAILYQSFHYLAKGRFVESGIFISEYLKCVF